MFVSEIKFMKRKNLGNYEHKEVALTVSLTEEDNAEAGMTYAEDFVNNALGSESKITRVVGVKSAELPEKSVDEVATKEVKAKSEEPKKSKSTKGKEKPAEEPKKEVIISKEEVNKKLIEVAKKFSSKEKAISLIKEVGEVESLSDLKPELYSKLVIRCEEVINAN